MAGKDNGASKLANKLISSTLESYSRVLYGISRTEFDNIVEYDVVNVVALFYHRMNAEQKKELSIGLRDELQLFSMEDVLEDLPVAEQGQDEVFMPLSCKLMERLGDHRLTTIVYQTVFRICTQVINGRWNCNDSYSNYLFLLNAAYFTRISKILHIGEGCRAAMQSLYSKDCYAALVSHLYEQHADDLEWDIDIDLDELDEFATAKAKGSIFRNKKEESKEVFLHASESMIAIRREHTRTIEEDAEGFDYIVLKTAIIERKNIDIQGFECHFCEARQKDIEYIIVYQKDTRIRDIIDQEEKWENFQRELYREDIAQNNRKSAVYIVYILDENTEDIPIQTIESNKTYGRKYVFSETETITFINGIVKTSHDEMEAVSPIREWDRILREEHLTGCLTEPYASKKVESYLSGQRFDADYILDDDDISTRYSEVPKVKWVKALDTTGFRDFCFDEKVMDFGQINLLYGANGSGKTSVLEAIEYALTAEVRRVKDFKIKLPTEDCPRLYVYDRESKEHVFTPEFSKGNSKEIDRVWYGVPISRNRSTLNDNFNRFNSFDSEAAYKFIHESDNTEESFSTMFGNLMFGEVVVDHEKKWQRFKRAFNERYSELRAELQDAKNWAAFYEESLSHRSTSSEAEVIEKEIVALKLLVRDHLPREAWARYGKILNELKIVRKYVELLSGSTLEEETFGEMNDTIVQTKREVLAYSHQRKDKSDEISSLAEENSEFRENRIEEEEEKEELERRINTVNTEIRNWNIVQNVLGHKDTLQLVKDIQEEQERLDRELYYILKIEQRTTVIKFLRLPEYQGISTAEKETAKKKLEEYKERKKQLENRYSEEKKAFGKREQQTIELRKIGKTLLVDSACPLCGHKYENTQQLIDIIDSAVVVNDQMEALIADIQTITKCIIDLENVLERQWIIDTARKELSTLKDTVPVISEYGTDFKRLYEYVASKSEKEKRKAELVEQQTTLDSQGFSVRNIDACKSYKTTDTTYLEYQRTGNGSYDDFLRKRLEKLQKKLLLSENRIEECEKSILKNEQKEELLRSQIHQLEAKIEALDADKNREIEQALENLKMKFDISMDESVEEWISEYHKLYDNTELEVERISSQGMITIEREQLVNYRDIIKKDTPMVERCARAVQAFERMPSLSSFVENGIRSNIQQISRFFKWMHHSGEFERLDIDEYGIYAVRGMNQQMVRTYEMSTGQRATIAMAVMFALHMAASDAPQFLLLDEPLATMDDTQVLNVLDILKSLAEQNTQIFFTTANGIMIDLFKKCFANTSYDYKEYQFVKRVNRPSEIKESGVNCTQGIESLTLDDLTLDFHQSAQIREILRKNQKEKGDSHEQEPSGVAATDENINLLHSMDVSNEKEEAKKVIKEVLVKEENPAPIETYNFFDSLPEEEVDLLRLLIEDDGESASRLKSKLSVYPTYTKMLDHINEAAIWYFGEPVVRTDSALPWVRDSYRDELMALSEEYSKR